MQIFKVSDEGRLIMIILWYIALTVLLFYGAKPCKKNTWNEENMSLGQTKAFLGFCAIIVIFHHMAQFTCASWLNPKYIRHGLDIFLTAGYPMVGVFFFCSGFGLYKSAKTKPDFFKRFLPVKILPILFSTMLTTVVFIFFRLWRNIPLTIDSPVKVNGHDNWHPSIWFIPAIIVMYIFFYIGFGLFKKDWIGILIVALGTLGYIGFCIRFGYGRWWINTVHMFLAGILLAKYEDRVFESCKKYYVLKLIIIIILCLVFYNLGNYKGGLYHFEVFYTLVFMSMYYLISMKLKIGNRALGFLGKITLEIYVTHVIFLHMFGYYMIHDGIKPVYYIENVSLYVLVCLALTIPVSYAISLVDKKIGNALKQKGGAYEEAAIQRKYE